MDVNIIFKDGNPKLSVYGLEGILLRLAGVNEYIVSKDPERDTLSTTFYFFVEKKLLAGNLIFPRTSLLRIKKVRI